MDFLAAHIEDLARAAQRQGMAHSRFLTPAEQGEVAAQFAKRQDVNLAFLGGTEEAERRVAVLTEPVWGSFEEAEIIAALRLTYRRQDTLTHRDVLGAAMALGIKRELLGDMDPGNPGVIVCMSEIADYLVQQLTQAGRVGLTLARMPLEAVRLTTKAMEQQWDTVASLRLDGLVAAMFRLSRSEASSHIRGGLVQVNHMLCQDTTRMVRPGDLLTLRGSGRARLVSEDGASRKGRIWITFEISG